MKKKTVCTSFDMYSTDNVHHRPKGENCVNEHFALLYIPGFLKTGLAKKLTNSLLLGRI